MKHTSIIALVALSLFASPLFAASADEIQREIGQDQKELFYQQDLQDVVDQLTCNLEHNCYRDTVDDVTYEKSRVSIYESSVNDDLDQLNLAKSRLAHANWLNRADLQSYVDMYQGYLDRDTKYLNEHIALLAKANADAKAKTDAAGKAVSDAQPPTTSSVPSTTVDTVQNNLAYLRQVMNDLPVSNLEYQSAEQGLTDYYDHARSPDAAAKLDHVVKHLPSITEEQKKKAQAEVLATKKKQQAAAIVSKKKKDAALAEWEKNFRAQQAKPDCCHLGMTSTEVLNSKKGAPNHNNRTTTRNGVSQQWVYADGSYLYFEDGVLVAIQD